MMRILRQLMMSLVVLKTWETLACFLGVFVSKSFYYSTDDALRQKAFTDFLNCCDIHFTYILHWKWSETYLQNLQSFFILQTLSWEKVTRNRPRKWKIWMFAKTIWKLGINVLLTLFMFWVISRNLKKLLCVFVCVSSSFIDFDAYSTALIHFHSHFWKWLRFASFLPFLVVDVN